MTTPNPAHLEYVTRIGDNALILAQRMSEWCGHAPVLEEDMALGNMSLDLIGQARMLLTHAGQLEGQGRDEDQLAFLRTEMNYRNLTLCELPNADFGRTMVRNFLFASFQVLLWERLLASNDSELAAIAAKSIKEARYHAQHAGDWVVRLGDGTAESHARTQAALDYLWPYTAEFFVATPADEAAAAAGIGPAWSELETAWEAVVVPVLNEATLTVPARTPFKSYGKFGRHSEYLGHLLSEMQYMQRTYPGAQW
ncbi:1,2-phenylacetyl-CoA epoxidase subunit PaaC [Azoarcus sp. DN11]|uniref:1,2-phenylacetyl-CoA epoxidase subunit PaaC n=1 Tax=Azoarcus sp. DN11 TaxID=356837 RepID=UPI000EB139FF|nr:1,2-phenylacetyl-CoA epoxidase subunit PaaC [Azoarcus sp. DN11]AYH42109.1 phenylacetate-CoA oxygenase subunit PaaI [Azoarcus sp. DN11]